MGVERFNCNSEINMTDLCETCLNDLCWCDANVGDMTVIDNVITDCNKLRTAEDIEIDKPKIIIK
jgi:hypothetical protein